MSNTLRNLTVSSVEVETESSGNEWSERSRCWAAKAGRTPPRKRRQRRTEPLVLTGHGLTVRVDKGCLFVKGGRTHYPAEPTELRYFKGGLDVPPSIITLDGSGTISLDALDWMAEQGIAFIRINYDGTNSIAMSPTGYAANPEKVRWQLETRDNAKRKLAFAIEITGKKLKAAIETLESFIPPSEKQRTAIAANQRALSLYRKAKSIPALLGIEGGAAHPYWLAWQGISINWKSAKRYPIPDEWKSFHGRSSLLSGEDRSNKRATSAIHCPQCNRTDIRRGWE